MKTFPASIQPPPQITGCEDLVAEVTGVVVTLSASAWASLDVRTLQSKSPSKGSLAYASLPPLPVLSPFLFLCLCRLFLPLQTRHCHSHVRFFASDLSRRSTRSRSAASRFRRQHATCKTAIRSASLSFGRSAAACARNGIDDLQH